jgi:hypothetical protein
MRCANCNNDNPRESVKCNRCGAILSRRIKRRPIAEESDTPFGGPVEGPNRPAVLAYRVAVIGLIPGLGLALGPLVIVWGMWVQYRGRREPEFTGYGLTTAAVLLGLFITLTNWLGLTLMIRGYLESVR